MKSERANITLANHTAKEMFFGYVHSTFVSVVGFKTGSPTEDEIAKVRAWSEPWLVPTGSLPVAP